MEWGNGHRRPENGHYRPIMQKLFLIFMNRFFFQHMNGIRHHKVLEYAWRIGTFHEINYRLHCFIRIIINTGKLTQLQTARKFS